MKNKIIEPRLTEAWKSIPMGEDITKAQTHFANIQSIYANPEGFDSDTLMYTVYATKDGTLLWGQTILEPVFVNGECNMTRGHFHVRKDRDEYYWCQQGEGLLALMDESGTCWLEKMRSGSLHHISGQWAHRCINTGNTPLSIIACWPADAGHDYGRIFPIRVYKENGQILLKEHKIMDGRIGDNIAIKHIL